MLILTATLVGTAGTRGAEVIWTNTVSGNWSVAANWNTGMIPGAGDHVYITNEAAFTATLDVNIAVASLVVGGASAKQTLAGNGRMLTIAETCNIHGNGVVNFTSCTVNGTGSLTNEGAFNLQGGTINVPLANAALLIFKRISSVNRTLTTEPGSVLRIEADQSNQGTLTVSNGFINAGMIQMTNSSSVPGQAVSLLVTSGKLVNAETGLILSSSPGSRSLNMEVENRGSVIAEGNLTLNAQSAFHTNSGTILIGSGASLTLNLAVVLGGRFEHTGRIEIALGGTLACNNGFFNYRSGTVVGPGTWSVFECRVNLTPNVATETVRLILTKATVNGPGTLTNSAGVTQALSGATISASLVNLGTLLINTTGSGVNLLETGPGSLIQLLGVNLTVTNGFVNRGTIQLTGQTDSTLAVVNGSLINDVGGSIQALIGAGGNRAINAPLNNLGELLVNNSLSLTSADGQTNRGTVLIDGGLVVVNSPRLVLTDTSQLHFIIRGHTLRTQFGQISMTGSAPLELGGALNLGLGGGFVPIPGDAFPVAIWSRHSGGFIQISGMDLGSGLFFAPMCDARGLRLETKSSFVPSPPSPTDLFDQNVATGQSANFFIAPVGEDPFRFQWTFHGTNLVDETNANLTIAGAQTDQVGPYCVVATDGLGVSTTNCAALFVLDPPAITTQPISRVGSPGGTVMFSVTASGSPPLRFQWRLNGANIVDATNMSYSVVGHQPRDGGDYSVVVANSVGAVRSSIANLRVTSATLGFADNFAAGGTIVGLSGVGSGVNTNATSEPAEPLHVGKPGGKSVWLRWTAPATGVASLETRGSSFDTLLAVYSGASIADLTVVAGDEDRGGFFTSALAFNAKAGSNYVVAIDGFHGAAGNIVLGWNLVTNIIELPRIILQPASLAVSPGNNATFSVFAASSSDLSYQWFFNDCLAIPGATQASFTVVDAGFLDVGAYSAEVSSLSGLSVRSREGFLELGPVADAFSRDKFEDLITGAGDGGSAGGTGGASGFVSVSVGSIRSQVLNNFAATTQANETNQLSLLGGSSKWFALTPSDVDAILQIDTIGSDIDTVLAVYTGDSLATLDLVASDNNGAPDHVRSLVRFAAKAGTRYNVAMDGVNGEQGIIQLNWRYGHPPLPNHPPFLPIVRDSGGIILSAGASSATDDVAYQWRINDRNINGETNSTLTISNVSAKYSVTVRNFAGSVTNTIIPLVLAYERLGAEGTLRITASAATAIVLEGSTTLSDWVALRTNAAPFASIEFTEGEAGNFPIRFYRARPWP